MTDANTASGAGLRLDAQTRADVITAAIAVLVDGLRRNGVGEIAALSALQTAPEKIDTALCSGRGALVLYRLDPAGARGIVSHDDARLSAFTAEATKDGSEVLGLNPGHIARLALDARGASISTQL